ncbi:phague integrase [Nocardia farcinica]|uniref:recombinase family protein n=1 Tax=Nocardia farcinica TaxID=37329 RepID=UPI000E0830A7|nr:recombinase family protein [Nocardia farcinica]SUE29617.1 phague integrase [Nocardia farcinica]
MSNPSLRAICGARVSVLTGPQKVSHLAQHETAAAWVAREGHTVVGTFTDLDVSASIPPEKRPDLGPWLTPEKSWEWDVLVFSKIDRAFRSTRHMVKLAEWCEQNRKMLVFAEDGLVLNYRNPQAGLEHMMAELFVYIGSFFAQLELGRFKSRAEDSHRILRFTERWPGGVPPFGYTTVPAEDGKGRVLAVDPEAKAVLEEMANHLVEDGWSLLQIAKWLNDQGIKSNMGKVKTNGSGWTPTSVRQVLSNLSTQGVKISAPGKTEGCKACEPTKGGCKAHRERVPVLDKEGRMIRMAEPIFSEERWGEIQDALSRRKINRTVKTRSDNPMRDGVGICGKCGLGLTIHRSPRPGGGYYLYTRCGSGCRGVSMKMDEAVDLLGQTFLENYGHKEAVEKVFVPGSDNSAELERVSKSIERLRAESDAGLITDDSEYLSRLTGLTARKRELEANPITPPHTVDLPTGETYAQTWERSDPEGRRQLLVKWKIQFILYGKNNFELRVPSETH